VIAFRGFFAAYLARHPRLATWLVLAVGMVALLLWASQGKGLEPSQLAWLVVSCIGLAGACAWIISWE